MTFVLAASLLLMVQFDNTALSAGNFVSVTVWVFVALSGVARKKAWPTKSSYQRHKQFARSMPRGTLQPTRAFQQAHGSRLSGDAGSPFTYRHA